MHDITQYIDQTILKPDTTQQEINVFIKEVARYGFFCAVVNPCWVRCARAELPLSTKVCSVVGFPLGATMTRTKIYAARELISAGCDEIDMVMNIGWFLSGEYDRVAREINDVVTAAQGSIVKVIIETCLLASDQIKIAAKIVKENGAHFVKTSTGFSTSGATAAAVRLLRDTVGPDFGVKASGGIRDYPQAIDLIQAGANRLGTSAGISIMQQHHNSV